MSKTIPDEIDIPVWYKPGGGRMFRRDCLPDDHPGSVYNYIKNELKLEPEVYGVFFNRELREEIGKMSTDAMITEIISLREQILSYERAGF